MEIGVFVGWKEHKSQPSPLKRSQYVNKSFFAEMMKSDKEAKMYNIMEGKDPEEVKMEDLKDEEDHPPKK
jgi:hypothetical protein